MMTWRSHVLCNSCGRVLMRSPGHVCQGVAAWDGLASFRLCCCVAAALNLGAPPDECYFMMCPESVGIRIAAGVHI